MIKWEYRTTILGADIDAKGVREYLRDIYPNWNNVPKYDIKTVEAQLDHWGKNGWELIHIEPISEVGKNGDILFTYLDVTIGPIVWRKLFLCVFKRPHTED